MATLADLLRSGEWENPNNPYSKSLLSDALRGSLSNAESLGRGFAAAPVGLVGDINALAREYVTPRLPAKAQEFLASMPSAPTTEQILSNVPRASDTRRETSGMEQLGAAMNPRGPIDLAQGAGKLAGEAINEAMVYGRGPLAQITPQPMRMFIGAESPMYNKDAAFKASQMLRKGVNPQEVWQQTGTGKYGNDFVQEISDANAKLRDYQFTPKEAIKNAMEDALISGEGSEKYKSMLPYKDMTKNQLLDEYKAVGQQIIDAAQAGDIEQAKQLQAGRSGLENMLGAMRSREYGPLSSFMSHGELNQAYPDIYQLHTRINPTEAGEAKGIYRPATSTVKEQMILGEKPMWNENKSTMLHEAQHAIQEREGWPKGGNSDEFARELIKERDALNAKITDLNQQMREAVGTPAYEDLMNQRVNVVKELLSRKLNDPVDLLEQAHKKYESLAGEAQARLTQRRMNLTPEERRLNYPFEYTPAPNSYGLDVPLEDLIYRSGANK